MDRKGAAPTPVFSSSCATMEGSDATLVASMAIKVADLSYPSKGRDYALVWIDRCLEEFFEQGDCEKELGLPVGYDRETLDKPKSQIGFFTFFVKPMYEALDKLTPLPDQLTNITELLEFWKDMVPSQPAQPPSI